MMQANEDRPRTRGGMSAGGAPRDDSTRPLVSSTSSRNSQPDHAHGKVKKVLDRGCLGGIEIKERLSRGIGNLVFVLSVHI